MEELVSIVVPIYRSEKYIEECLESILEQEYTALEIILINDGSPDKCDIICEKYSKEYGHVKVLHQKNQGPGIARATGVKEAKGKYILFVDSDDCMDGPDVVRKLVECAEREQADIVVGSFRTFCDEELSEVNYHHLDELKDTDSVEFRFRGYFQYGHLGFNWGKLYRKEFLEKYRIEYQEYPYIEDKAYNMRCTANKPKYAFVKESVYCYRTRRQEIPFQDKDDFVTVWTKVAEEFDAYLQERNLRDAYGDLVGIHMFLGVYTLANKILRDEQSRKDSLKDALKAYCTYEFAEEQFRKLKKEAYVKEVDSFIWRLAIRVTAWSCCMKWYGLLAVGMKLINRLHIDQKVIAKKYRE